MHEKCFFMFKFFISRQVKILKRKKSHKKSLGIPQKSLKPFQTWNTVNTERDMKISVLMDRLKTFTCRILCSFFEWLMTETWLEFLLYLGLSFFHLALLRNNKSLWKGYQSIRDCLHRTREIWHDNNQYFTFYLNHQTKIFQSKLFELNNFN